MPTIKEIVREYLEKNGYDGLFNDDCACLLNDLYPCGEIGNCQAGYKGACNGGDCEGDCDFHIYGDKADALRADEEREVADR
jgi:hypothetical protein